MKVDLHGKAGGQPTSGGGPLETKKSHEATRDVLSVQGLFQGRFSLFKRSSIGSPTEPTLIP